MNEKFMIKFRLQGLSIQTEESTIHKVAISKLIWAFSFCFPTLLTGLLKTRKRDFLKLAGCKEG